jgi:pectate lyase
VSGDSITIQESAAGFCHVDGTVAAIGSGFTGAGYANPDNDQTNGVDWRVTVPAAGIYRLTFRYAGTDTTETGSVVINEASPLYPINFPATVSATTDWNEAFVDVSLTSGENAINIGTADSDGLPNIDSLRVTGNNPQAVSCAVDAAAQNTAACNALTAPASSTIDPNELMGFASVNALGVATTDGGGSATPVTVTTSSANLAAAVSGNAAKVVQVSGTLTGSGMIDVGSNTTVIGLGTDATLNGFGLKVDGRNNVIITNLNFTNGSDDGVTIEDNAHHVWAHHNTFTAPFFDGSLDIRRSSSYITVAWNHFVGTDKTMLAGSSDTEFQSIGNMKVTYHHNWFDGTVQRNPRLRFGEFHIFNNLYDQVTSYGIVSVQFSDTVAQNNYFDVTSGRAVSTGGVAESPHKGDVVACNNGSAGAVTVETRGTALNPGAFYSFDMQDAVDVSSTVTSFAGVQ